MVAQKWEFKPCRLKNVSFSEPLLLLTLRTTYILRFMQNDSLFEFIYFLNVVLSCKLFTMHPIIYAHCALYIQCRRRCSSSILRRCAGFNTKGPCAVLSNWWGFQGRCCILGCGRPLYNILEFCNKGYLLKSISRIS